MAHRHLMAVCVVCLLCAEHMPCKEHVAMPSKNLENLMGSQDSSHLSNGIENLLEVSNIPSSHHQERRKERSAVVRKKRHVDHDHHKVHSHHHLETPEVTKIYIQKIFREFSNRNTNTMNIAEFEKMMLKMDLKSLLTEQPLTDNSTCMTGKDFLGKMTNTEESADEAQMNHHSHDEDEEHDHPSTFLERIKIETDHMLAMCPILLYHVVNRQSSIGVQSCLNVSDFLGPETFIENEEIEMAPRSAVWLYSTLSIIGVSLCGLLGVAVIPIMEKHFYHHVLQFLVALAVGTLAGDALLHLLPHAMMPTYEGQDMHHTMMLRGLATVGGIVFFYFFERFLTIITDWRQKKQKRDKPSSRVRVMRDPESVSINNGTATCKHKYSSYPYCYDEIAMETKDDHHEHQHIEGNLLNNHSHNHIHNKKPKNQDDPQGFAISTPSEIKKNNGVFGDLTIEPDNNTLSTSLDDGSIASNPSNNNKAPEKLAVVKSKDKSVQEESYTIILKEHQSKHHGHSHNHGHVYSPPRSLSAVVWMVIAGDGLHNFTDGMAIGAAFSNSIAGGFSTSVAVFCHELPHELGDFAVLLKAGMSAKQAVYYNILSSILSFFGMCVGIMIGDTPEASQWIFAVAAGLFIYIALVDMMPELTSSNGKEEGFMATQIILQFLGMCCGFSTMFLIAIYEHDLKEIFDS